MKKGDAMQFLASRDSDYDFICLTMAILLAIVEIPEKGLYRGLYRGRL